jgi:hypothetical protein
MAIAESWYWDLKQGRAVSAADRGPGDDVLGPYPTKEAAENWRATHDARDETWEKEDREWEGEDG